jgi:hypothetical protein
MPEVASEHWMQCDGSLAVKVLAISNLLHPTTPNHDPLAVVFNVGPL